VGSSTFPREGAILLFDVLCSQNGQYRGQCKTLTQQTKGSNALQSLKNLTLAQYCPAVPGKTYLNCYGDTDFGAMRMLGRFTMIMLCGLLAGFPVIAQPPQTVELSTRTFWLGEAPNTMSVDPPFFAPRRVQWIEKIIEADPVLKDTVIHVELALLPASKNAEAINMYYAPLRRDRLDPRYDLPGYLIFGSPVSVADPTRLPNRLHYIPQSPDAGFDVTCSVDNLREKMRLCIVYATYPPDDGIRLKARLYFPKDPATRPGYFREVAERMRDLVYCLDVTDDLVDVQKARPSLTGCRPDVNS